MRYSEWKKYYGQWLNECNNELIEKGHNPKECEVCENGQIYFLGTMVLTGHSYVTPWKNSKYYKE